jgi:glycosyltransferase involved in cell wall biosynthesis
MSANPLVSIVLPTYNGSRYLSEAIESCAQQTYSHWELIIVDDASVDETPQIIAHWTKQDSRIRSLRNKTNCKLPNALNTGFATANGDLLTWTSDDNKYRPNALATMVNFLENNSEVDLVYSDFSKIDEQGQVIDQICVADPQQLAVVNCVQGSFIYRRTVYESIGGYDEGLRLVEDWDYWLRTLRDFELAPLHQDLYEYRSHAESLTRTKKVQVKQATEQLLSSYLKDSHLFSRRARARGYLKLNRLSFAEGRHRDARRYLLRALMMAPSEAVCGSRSQLASSLFGQRITGLLRRVRTPVRRDIPADGTD